MANPIEYIVFEPDQVLTNDHLNETFNYLDQQNRWTRNKLIGIGIVCGLDIALNPGVIEISKGCGVTSQGYLITQPATIQYNYYIPYTAVDVPDDLPFVYDKEGGLPFYKPFCTDKNVWLLLSDSQFNALENAQKLNAKTLSSADATFLSDYVVALFLEARETDLKNCDTQDCNNKGEKMVLQIRPLLVAKNDLYQGSASKVIRTDITKTDIITRPVLKPISREIPIKRQPLKLSLKSKIQLKRFNVPYADINNADDLLNTFVKLVDDDTLNQVSDAYNSCYQEYSAVLKIDSNPFEKLVDTLTNYRDQVLKQNPLFIEYFYDFVDDLIKAYNEFMAKVSGIISTCCPDENLFPLHLVLGDASLATNAYVKDSYRNYFIYSPLFSKMGTESAEVIFLFTRMVLLVKDFIILNPDELAKAPITITPSQYEHPWLSHRAIPFYYTLNETGAELYKLWNYRKTMDGNAAFNLSYNAGLYNSNPLVTQPLLYDIERFNFFRIEGHIGRDYKTVLSNILDQRLTYNLPFDVVAVSAQQAYSSDKNLPDEDKRDLETDYNLIVTETTVKVLIPLSFVANLPYTSRATNGTNLPPGKFSVETETPVKRFSEFKSEAVLNITTAKAFDTGNGRYTKGDFIRYYCSIQPNTIGSAYLNGLSSTGEFTNPVMSYGSGSVEELYHFFFEFLDAVENLMVYLLNINTIANVDVSGYYYIFRSFRDSITQVIATLKGPVAKTPVSKDASMISLIEAYETDLLIVDLQTLTDICLDDRLWTLTSELTDRINTYAQKFIFTDYYKKHPGLEHKAGVPKGGTLVLVYKPYINRSLTRPIPNDRLKAAGAPVVKADSTAIAKARLLETQAAPTKRSQVLNLDENTLSRVTKLVADTRGVSDVDKSRLIDILAGRGQSDLIQDYDIEDNVVIADFYIPYIGNPIDYSTADVEPPQPPKPVITMSNAFCDNDTNPATISVSPEGGTFNSVPGLDPDKLTFTPSAAKAGTYSIVYTVDDISSDPFVVTVLETPSGGFDIKTESVDTVKQIVRGTFIPSSRNDAFTYNWQISGATNEGVTPDGIITVSASYRPPKGVDNVRAQPILIPVTLTVSNGNCQQSSNSVSITVSNQGFTFGDGASMLTGIKSLFTRKKKE
jgi:hypothetical protein